MAKKKIPVLKMKIKPNLRGETQRDFAERIGMAPTHFSPIVRNQRSTINRYHAGKIISEIGTKDMNDIFEIVFEEVDIDE